MRGQAIVECIHAQIVEQQRLQDEPIEPRKGSGFSEAAGSTHVGADVQERLHHRPRSRDQQRTGERRSRPPSHPLVVCLPIGFFSVTDLCCLTLSGNPGGAHRSQGQVGRHHSFSHSLTRSLAHSLNIKIKMRSAENRLFD